MPTQCYEVNGVRVVECGGDGPRIGTDHDAVELIGAASEHAPELMVIPVDRFGDGFFQLKTRMAGEILQKFVTYHVRVAIVGDISGHLSESGVLMDFVRECNRGCDIWFAASMEEIWERLLG